MRAAAPRRRGPRSVDAGALLVGPAGTGKSVVAAAAAERAGRVAWAWLAPGFDSAADLVGLTAASLGVELDPEGLTLLELASVLCELLEASPTILVIDDYQHAVGRGV